MNLIAQKNRYLKQENKRFEKGVFTSIDQSEWPPSQTSRQVLAVYRSRDFLVTVYGGQSVRLSICRTWLDQNGRFQDGISWDEMQEIKNKCGYADRDAVEIYPKEQDIVNVANMRHLWIIEENALPFIWRKK
jgi:hypothetical protein